MTLAIAKYLFVIPFVVVAIYNGYKLYRIYEDKEDEGDM